MKPGAIVFQGKVGETELTVRYPTLDDVAVLLDFVNEASQERTFIRIQGVTLTFEEEAQYLNDVLSKMEAGTMVKLLAFRGEKLLGAADVTRQPYTENHLGLFGIVVHKSARGMGIGKKLMELVLSETKKEMSGIETIILACHAQNSVGLHLYETFGFAHYGRLPKGVKKIDGYDDKILMYRSLK